MVLYREKKDCCACEACKNICPQNAISMQEDSYGFLYPAIDKEKCIECGQCKRVCGYQNMDGVLHKPKTSMAAAAKDVNLIKKSASGGVFASLAKTVLKRKGVVYGCAFLRKKEGLYPEHIRIENLNELYRLQGSKYVQSRMENIYRHIDEDLKGGRLVLFSGTPCQVNALNYFLGKQDKSKLLTVDIVCHGVANATFFSAYLTQLERRLKGEVIDFQFRDKTDGWGKKGAVYYINKKGRNRKKIMPALLSSYYALFLKAYTYRENCYSCKYADSSRTGDITIGDFWGIENEHPEYLTKNGGKLDAFQGISCVLINTKQGQDMLTILKPEIRLEPTTFEKISKWNEPLRGSCKKRNIREKILNLYVVGGYRAVDDWYYKKLGMKKYIYEIWYRIPNTLQEKIKRIFLAI